MLARTRGRSRPHQPGLNDRHNSVWYAALSRCVYASLLVVLEARVDRESGRRFKLTNSAS